MSTTPTNSESSGAQVANQLNGVARDLQSLQTTQIFKDDTGTRRVLLGRGKDGFYGLKVSQEGVDVYDAANDDLVFNSDQNVFKIVASGTTTIPAFTLTASGLGWQANGTTSDVITHNLGYLPAVLAYVSGTNNYTVFPNQNYVVVNGVGGGFSLDWYSAYVDSTTTSFAHNAIGFNDTNSYSERTIKYYLLQETAN